MQTVHISDQSILALLLQAKESGGLILEADNGVSAVLMPKATAADQRPKVPRVPGALRGKIIVHGDFNDPLPDEFMKHFLP